MLYICDAQYGSHQPYVASEHLKCAYWDQGTGFKFN